MPNRKKACPLGVTKISLWAKIIDLIKRNKSYTCNCLENRCAWWDNDCSQCSVNSINDIANVMWNDDRE